MSEYEQNMDFNDVFNYFSLHPAEQSQILSIHSQSSNSQQNCEDFQNELFKNIDCPTRDKTISKPYDSKLGGLLETQGPAEVKIRNEMVRTGSKDDTVELNINFKTIVYNHFKELLLANELSPEQAQRLQQFGNRSPSFKSFLIFCANSNGENSISQTCASLVQSSLIIRRILQSRCKMVTKIRMIKFVEILRLNIRGSDKIYKWKHHGKK